MYTEEECGQLGLVLLHGGQQRAGLPGAGDDAAVDLVSHLRGLPGHLVDRIGGQQVQLDGVAEYPVDDGAFAGDGGGGRGPGRRG
jgi:hypothetical protein